MLNTIQLGGKMVFEKIRSILSKQFDLDENLITYKTEFVKDLNADSLDIIDLFSTISNEFNIKENEDILNNFNTVGDVVNYIESKL